VELAELLGDHELLAHFRACCPGAPAGGAPPAAFWEGCMRQQQQQQQQVEQQQRQQLASAPQPGAAAAAAAARQQEAHAWSAYWAASASASAGPQQQQQRQQQQREEEGALPLRGAAAYADAVLSALPEDDEAVQLARLAASAGRPLHEVADFARGGGGGGEYAATASRDPRTGRITAAAHGGEAGPEGAAASLYGDMGSWCDPAQLEGALQRHAAARKRGLPVQVGAGLLRPASCCCRGPVV
jgi:hypothetical protein